MNINDIDFVDRINSKEEFLIFLDKLIKEYNSNGRFFANRDLDSFLRAMHSWLEDVDESFGDGKTVPKHFDWRFLAHILSASKMYE